MSYIALWKRPHMRGWAQVWLLERGLNCLYYHTGVRGKQVFPVTKTGFFLKKRGAIPLSPLCPRMLISHMGQFTHTRTFSLYWVKFKFLIWKRPIKLVGWCGRLTKERRMSQRPSSNSLTQSESVLKLDIFSSPWSQGPLFFSAFRKGLAFHFQPVQFGKVLQIKGWKMRPRFSFQRISPATFFKMSIKSHFVYYIKLWRGRKKPQFIFHAQWIRWCRFLFPERKKDFFFGPSIRMNVKKKKLGLFFLSFRLISFTAFTLHCSRANLQSSRIDGFHVVLTYWPWFLKTLCNKKTQCIYYLQGV